ncbi:MAG: hypothetical protein E5X60_08840 [Mesorhizobium sp.]|nr:MAG: hypothetical protein E5X60_08840 [Mesorhizobium sp.]
MGICCSGEDDISETAGKASPLTAAFVNGTMQERQGDKGDSEPDKNAGKQERRNAGRKPKSAKHDEDNGGSRDKEGGDAVRQPGPDGGKVCDQASHDEAESGGAGRRW